MKDDSYPRLSILNYHPSLLRHLIEQHTAHRSRCFRHQRSQRASLRRYEEFDGMLRTTRSSPFVNVICGIGDVIGELVYLYI